jgi:hypothetical protein
VCGATARSGGVAFFGAANLAKSPEATGCLPGFMWIAFVLIERGFMLLRQLYARGVPGSAVMSIGPFDRISLR